MKISFLRNNSLSYSDKAMHVHTLFSHYFQRSYPLHFIDVYSMLFEIFCGMKCNKDAGRVKAISIKQWIYMKKSMWEYI